MESRSVEDLKEDLIKLIELSRRPYLSDGARAVIALQMTVIQDTLDRLAPR